MGVDRIGETQSRGCAAQGVSFRRRKAWKGALTLLGIGSAYAVLVHLLGFGIPCPIHLVTGLQCPGCGITRMVMALLRLDLNGAFKANAGVLCLLPLMLFTAGRAVWLYIHKGSTRSKLNDALIWFMIAVLLLFGVIRNFL